MTTSLLLTDIYNAAIKGKISCGDAKKCSGYPKTFSLCHIWWRIGRFYIPVAIGNQRMFAWRHQLDVDVNMFLITMLLDSNQRSSYIFTVIVLIPITWLHHISVILSWQNLPKAPLFFFQIIILSSTATASHFELNTLQIKIQFSFATLWKGLHDMCPFSSFEIQYTYLSFRVQLKQMGKYFQAHKTL